ncbi:MAG: hypothetical protein IJB96_02825 [Lachnospira sp.]|nr:hypothetical protein [Lachnospira sp.]
MDKNEKIAVAIGAAVLVVLALLLFAIREYTRSNDDNDVVPETDTFITDDNRTVDVHENVSAYDVNNAEVKVEEDKKLFYLKLDNDIITIYKENGDFYDYARIDTKSVPEEVLGELKMGMEITGEDSLYEFLQGYAD